MSNKTYKWLKVTDTSPAEYQVVLTFHEDDIHPVCAFLSIEDGEMVWRRVTEGPEDEINYRSGSYGILSRTPTFWLDLRELNLNFLSSNKETFHLR